MKHPFTARQGETLAFIHRFSVKHGVSPSFGEIASHFGTSTPSVNGMIKMLERRGLLSRVPGMARSLKVLVPPSLLPDSEFGPRAARPLRPSIELPETASRVEAAIAAAMSVMAVFLEDRDSAAAARLTARAAKALETALVGHGLSRGEALEASRRVAADAQFIAVHARAERIRRSP
ncbi:MAG: hypothetical protein HYY18_06745 [Planctomycetes bacterium]|nr:hypothetical protein [Planctomycetota bacterium]